MGGDISIYCRKELHAFTSPLGTPSPDFIVSRAKVKFYSLTTDILSENGHLLQHTALVGFYRLLRIVHNIQKHSSSLGHCSIYILRLKNYFAEDIGPSD